MKKQLKDYLKTYQLDELFTQKVCDSMKLETYAAGERLFSQGEKSDKMHLLVDGKLKVSMLTPEGKRLILAFKTPLDIVGDIEYVRDCPLINTVESVMETTVIEIPYAILRKEMAQHAPWLQFLLNTVTKKFEMKSHTMNFNLLYPVDVRLASYLLSMTPVQPVITSASLIDIADLIGTSYRHLNRVLQQFQQNGWIVKKRGSIEILNRQALLELAGENIYEKEAF
ncbi:Crp/Fnr family transcriptional regulator [Jeotgalibacillus sp. JSM ZJ347]|uniref:Crp/Fnr family transcriptional regulator n=1 Tax=Jeotgalibacillus sp. JSM ZJ347 TaxID=3342117 RepID=UPI0035A8A4FD